MSVKILGGFARGFSLATPKTESTRPTSVMIRRKLFDWRQSLEGYVFIDLFAGSGAMGLEALSRGACCVYLNDLNRLAVKTLKQNSERFIQSFKQDPASVVVTNLDAVKWVTRELLYQLTSSEDVILYLDPPYENKLIYSEVLKQLRDLNFDGEVWVESHRLVGPKRDEVSQAFNSIIKTIDQGDHFVLVGKVI
jgi:16S rRNA (guanine966-N2)-methyltransferase